MNVDGIGCNTRQAITFGSHWTLISNAVRNSLGLASDFSLLQ